jgi:acyl-CoA thioesterase-1
MGRWRVGLKVALLAMGILPASGAAAASCRLAVLGDSLTAGYGLAAAEAFPVRLEAALRARGVDCEVLDAGVSGDTSSGGAARLDWVLAERPTHLMVELGGNDALRALPPETLRANLESIVARARAAGVEVLIAGMLAPPNLGPEYGQAFADAYRLTAEAHDVPLYPFFLDGVAGEPELLLRDGIHPDARGVEVIVERILPVVERWLRTAGSGGKQ